MDEAYSQAERRSSARYMVDTDASLVLINQAGALRGKMFELSLDGCRVRAERPCAVGAPAGIEVIFQMNGIAFRLGGTMQWMDAQHTAGVRFNPMAPRRREALEEVLAELEAEQAKAAAKGEPPAVALPATPPIPVVTINFHPPDAPRPEPSRPDRESPPQNTDETIASSREEIRPGAGQRGRDRRSEARHALDTGATIFFIDVRAEIQGRILDVSMSGCRIRTFERFPVGIYRRVETEFKVDGLPFRLGGVVQSIHDRFTVGIRFLDMSARKREQLEQLMGEMDEMRSLEKHSSDRPG